MCPPRHVFPRQASSSTRRLLPTSFISRLPARRRLPSKKQPISVVFLTGSGLCCLQSSRLHPSLGASKRSSLAFHAAEILLTENQPISVVFQSNGYSVPYKKSTASRTDFRMPLHRDIKNNRYRLFLRINSALAYEHLCSSYRRGYVHRRARMIANLQLGILPPNIMATSGTTNARVCSSQQAEPLMLAHYVRTRRCNR
jgi:hypothetical protein